MKMTEVIQLPEYEFGETRGWWAVIGPGKMIKHLCSDKHSAEQLKMREGPATHEVKLVRHAESSYT